MYLHANAKLGLAGRLALGARDRGWSVVEGGRGRLQRLAGVEEETDDPKQAYARFRPSEPARYREGWLPDLG